MSISLRTRPIVNAPLIPPLESCRTWRCRAAGSGTVADLLVDTDVFIDHLRGACRLPVDDDDDVSCSVVTLCELYAGSRVDEGAVRTLLAPFTPLVVDRAVAERAGRVRRETGTRIGDALIAATALEHDLTLMTRNIRDFAQVPGLLLSQPPSR